MRLHTIWANADDDGVIFDKLIVVCAKFASLSRAARRVVLWVEIKHHVFAYKVL